MALFRLARADCPACGHAAQAHVPETEHRRKSWSLTCPGCGHEWSAQIDPAWRISYRDPGGRLRRKRIGPDRRTATRVLSKIEVSIAENKYIDRAKRCRTTLGELRDAYLEHLRPLRKPGNLLRDRSCLDNVASRLGRDLPIASITEATGEDYRRQRLAEGAAPATCNRELGVFSGALTYAVKRGLIPSKPKLPTPPPNNERVRFLGKAEIRTLLEACGEDIRDIVKAALSTGMRRGELLAMRWDWINLRTGQISIPAAASKSGKGRPIPINTTMRRVLERARTRAVSGAPVLHFEGRSWSAPCLHKRWRAAVDKTGIDNLRFHDLRHCAASAMVQGGATLYQVSLVLGHSTLAMSQKYAHLAPSHLKDAMALASVEDVSVEPGCDADGAQTAHSQVPAEIIPFQPRVSAVH
ncbi:MAG: tyrosine-type recombinase/integrase [Deltaproteobacteria bacterium]|nr:tyrosine-type recombinase/integrase [Deltaproteobacteria bacterium]